MAAITVGPAYAYSDGSSDSGSLHIVTVVTGQVKVATSTQLSIVNLFGYTYTFTGSGVTYDTSMTTAGGLQLPLSGVINELRVTKDDGTLAFDMAQLDVSAAALGQTLWSFTTADQEQAALKRLLAGDDSFVGGRFQDRFGAPAARNVTVQGGGGDDIFIGGSGTNTAIYSGRLADYFLIHTKGANNQFTVRDTRAGSPDGQDTLNNFQVARFSDVTLTLSSYDVVASQALNVLRVDPLSVSSQPIFSALLTSVAAQSTTTAQIAAEVALAADATTSVATMSYQFFTGATPTPAGLDYLVSPTGSNTNNLNSRYYAQFSTENRYINFAVNLGKLGAGAAAFKAAYGSLSLTDATSKAYAAIFGAAPTADKLAHLLNDPVADGHGGAYARQNYFAAYGGDGVTGVGTKAAMVGWLIAQADAAHVGVLETANMAYLLDLGMGKIAAAVDLVGVYHGTPYAGG